MSTHQMELGRGYGWTVRKGSKTVLPKDQKLRQIEPLAHMHAVEEIFSSIMHA
jgi:hypothetical protein